MRYLRATSATFTTAAFYLTSSSGWAQQVGDQNTGLLESMTRFLHLDPLLVAAVIIALTLVLGLALDAMRGRFRRSEGDKSATANDPQGEGIEAARAKLS